MLSGFQNLMGMFREIETIQDELKEVEVCAALQILLTRPGVHLAMLYTYIRLYLFIPPVSEPKIAAGIPV